MTFQHVRVEMRSWGFHWMMYPIMDADGFGEDIRYKLDSIPDMSPIHSHPSSIPTTTPSATMPVMA